MIVLSWISPFLSSLMEAGLRTSLQWLPSPALFLPNQAKLRLKDNVSRKVRFLTIKGESNIFLSLLQMRYDIYMHTLLPTPACLPDSKSLSRLPSFLQQGLAGFIYRRPWWGFFCTQRSERQPYSWKACDRQRETGDGGTVPGAAAKPCVLTGTSIMATEQGAPKVPPRGKLGKGSRKEAHPCFIIKMLSQREISNYRFLS